MTSVMKDDTELLEQCMDCITLASQRLHFLKDGGHGPTK